MKDHNWISILTLIIAAALAYLPLIHQIGYSHDDWYLMYSAWVKGPAVFWEIFSIDRPWRALVMIPAYELFGSDPLYYHLSAFIFRVAGGLALYWSLDMLWRHQRTTITLITLLFLMYPGFLSQPNAIDYQCHIVGMGAALASVAFTLKGIFTEHRTFKVVFHTLAILLGLLYLGQMEWYVGIEGFRWACVFIYSSRLGGTVFQKGIRTIRWVYPSLVAPAAFFIWRIFFFESKRSATDIGVQFEQVKLYPLQTLYSWIIQIAQDFFDVLLSAWVIPFSQLMGFIQRWGGILAILVTGFVLIGLQQLERSELPDSEEKPDATREALLLGIFTAIAGLIPIALVNREVSFPFYSRYSLISSVGVAIMIVAVLTRVRGKILRYVIMAGLYLVAFLTHHANAVKHAQETVAISEFWWQVSWRVPQFERNTTLIANYPAVAIEEDYFVWGPASLIYYPEDQNPKLVQPGLFASVLNKDAVTRILARERQEYDNRRGIITYKNYRNILVLTQPSKNSCVHIINGNQAEYSPHESDSIRVVGSFSEIEHVLTEETPHTPPEVVFGPEPPHDWCYYYQKADLARQRGDWEEVSRLGAQAIEKGFAPQDKIEWLPFLQAYAVAGATDRLTEMASAIAVEPYISQQACQQIGSLQGLSDPVMEVIDSLYCLE